MIVAVIGGGKIGEAVARSIAESGNVSKVIMTRRAIRTQVTSQPQKLILSTDNPGAAQEADVIIIAVKAGDAKQVLGEIAPQVSGKIVISLMAAVSIHRLEHALPGAKVVRSMPNIAAIIG